MKKVLIVAPHPDDETLGCGGTLLRHKALGDEVSWLIVTGMTEQAGFLPPQVAIRRQEIDEVARMYRFDKTYNLELKPAELDTYPVSRLVGAVGDIFKSATPEILYIPYFGDIHSDHQVVFNVCAACSKWFRYPSIKKVLAYETISETDFGINPGLQPFRPNVFADVTNYLDQKLAILRTYANEIAPHPFPRSEQAVRALAELRGSEAGFKAAEAFMLIKEII